jgi:hypothetical protein
MTQTKRKGMRAEHRAIRILEAAGYFCTRAGGSLGLFDVLENCRVRRGLPLFPNGCSSAPQRLPAAGPVRLKRVSIA